MMDKQLAVIFDLDGTIVDSTADYRAVWAELIAEYGLDDDPNVFVARGTRENVRVLLGEDASAADIERHAAEQAARGQARMRARGVRSHPGMVELIHALRALGIKLALATAAERSNAEWCLEQLGIQNDFDSVVVDQDVAHGKPAPDVYLAALERLGAETSDCVVIEDSVTGTLAAKRAGLRVLAVLTTHSRRALQEAGADEFAVDTAALTPERVIAFIESAHG